MRPFFFLFVWVLSNPSMGDGKRVRVGIERWPANIHDSYFYTCFFLFCRPKKTYANTTTKHTALALVCHNAISNHSKLIPTAEKRQCLNEQKNSSLVFPPPFVF
ncbi:hypothetical protein EDD21DRAFT_391057 [Dissophora ornata]|nr:hypothetical protein EDD21DRAFT_391057 [Dissophora ornata]